MTATDATARAPLAEVIATVQRALEVLGEGHASLAAACDSTSDDAPMAAALLRQAVEHADAAAAAVTENDRALGEYVAAVLGGPGGSTSHPVGRGHGGGPGPYEAVPAPQRPGMLEALPVRQSPKDQTAGVLTGVDGGRLADLSSGAHGPGRGGPGLGGRRRHEGAAVDHVEGHAAAVMRTRGLTRAVLYLNNQPCKHPRGCDRMLHDLLPAGAELTDYGSDGFVKVYVGTGKGLA